MELDLNRLSAVETPIHGELRLADDADSSLAADGIRFPEPVRIDGTARLDRGIVVVAGRVAGALELECGRCLERFRQPVDLEFESRYAPASAAPRQAPPASPHGVADSRGDDDGVELERADLDVSFLRPGTTSLIVEDVVREQLLLEVPLRPLCQAQCGGLCPRCGANLNEMACGCPREEVHDLRLAGLAELKRRLEGRSGREDVN